LGSGVGCERLALMLERGDGGEPDHPRAVTLLKKLCDEGLGTSCKYLADYQPDSGSSSRALLERGCQLEAIEACDALRSPEQHGISKETRRWADERARLLNERACALGNEVACRAVRPDAGVREIPMR
jgi:TPR repeat protein